jgi:hypothetical protein
MAYGVRTYTDSHPYSIPTYLCYLACAQKKKDPNAPKKPLSAYMFFCAEHRARIKEENPDFKVTQITSELGKAWGAATEVCVCVCVSDVTKPGAPYLCHIAVQYTHRFTCGNAHPSLLPVAMSSFTDAFATQSEKKPFYEQAEKDKARYEKENAAYKAGAGDEEEGEEEEEEDDE